MLGRHYHSRVRTDIRVAIRGERENKEVSWRMEVYLGVRKRDLTVNE